MTENATTGCPPTTPPLVKSRLFDGISDETRAVLRDQGRRRKLVRGDTLFTRGARQVDVHVLAAGQMKLWRALEDGGVVSLLMLGHGELLSAMPLINHGPYVASATALTGVTLDTWPVAVFEQLQVEDPQLARNLSHIVAVRAERMVERIDEISGMSVEQRVARALVRLCCEMDDGTDDRSADLPLSRQDLAELTSTTLHTVSRILSRWREKGLVGGGRGRILVHCLSAVAAIAGLPPEEEGGTS